MKKEGTTKGSWKRRWFVLRKTTLLYLKRPESTHTQGSIPVDTINHIVCKLDEYPDQLHCFQLVRAAVRLVMRGFLRLLHSVDCAGHCKACVRISSPCTSSNGALAARDFCMHAVRSHARRPGRRIRLARAITRKPEPAK
jgi:hypothetical protein